MLERDDSPNNLPQLLIEPLRGIELPGDQESFFGKTGLIPSQNDERRRFPRFYFRHAALLKVQSTLPAFPREPSLKRILTRDISRQGVGLLVDQQFFPKERCLLILPNVWTRSIEIASCRKLSARCFEVGARFLADPSETI
jgi:hypothetical protein